MKKNFIQTYGLAWYNRKQKEQQMYQSFLATKSTEMTVAEICDGAAVSRGTFFNYYEDVWHYNIMTLNRTILDLYHENPNLKLEDYAKELLKSPKLHFCSTVLKGIEDDKMLCVLDKDEITFYYDVVDAEPYLNCLNRIFSRSFITIMLDKL